MGHKKLSDEYITIPDAARTAGVTKQTMYNHVLIGGQIPYESRISGAMTFYKIRRDDFDHWMETRGLKKVKKVKKEPKRAKLYEIVNISCGEVAVLYTTDNLHDLSMKYIKLMEHEHKFCRIRADGKMLTIHESDELGNTCHPRSRRIYK